MPRLTVEIIQLNGEFAAAHVLVLQFQAVKVVIKLAIDTFAVIGERRAAVDIHAFQQRQLFTFNADCQFIKRDLLLADTLLKGGHFGGAVGLQVAETELDFLVVFVDRVDLPAGRFAAQADRFAIAIGIELELAAAKDNFFIVFSVIQRVKEDGRLGIAAVGNTGVDVKRRLPFGDIEQRFAGIVIHQSGVDRGHCRYQVKRF